jgi:hypothetical protein
MNSNSEDPPGPIASHPDAEADDAEPERERILIEREQNAVLAVDEVDDVDGKRRKLKIALFVLFIMGTVTTLAIVLTSPTVTSPTVNPLCAWSSRLTCNDEGFLPVLTQINLGTC